jgi:hypothetical protein
MLKNFYSTSGLQSFFQTTKPQKLKKQVFIEGLYLKIDSKLPLEQKQHLLVSSPYTMRLWDQVLVPVWNKYNKGEKVYTYSFIPKITTQKDFSRLGEKETQVSFTIKYEAGFSIEYVIQFSPRKTIVSAKFPSDSYYRSEDQTYRGKIQNDVLFDLIIKVTKQLEKRLEEHLGWVPLGYLLKSYMTGKQTALSKGTGAPLPSITKITSFINKVSKALSLPPKLTKYGETRDKNVFLPPLNKIPDFTWSNLTGVMRINGPLIGVPFRRMHLQDAKRLNWQNPGRQDNYLFSLRVTTGAQGFIANIFKKLEKHKSINAKVIKDIVYPIGEVVKNKTYSPNIYYGRVVSFTENTYRILDLRPKAKHYLYTDAFTQQLYGSLPPLKTKCEIVPSVYNIVDKKQKAYIGYIKALTEQVIRDNFWDEKGKILDYGGSFRKDSEYDFIQPSDSRVRYYPSATKLKLNFVSQKLLGKIKLTYEIVYPNFRAQILIYVTTIVERQSKRFSFLPKITLFYNKGYGDLRHLPRPPHYIRSYGMLSKIPPQVLSNCRTRSPDISSVLNRIRTQLQTDDVHLQRNKSKTFTEGLKEVFVNSFTEIEERTNYLEHPDLIGGVPVWSVFYKALRKSKKPNAKIANLSRVQWKRFLIRLFKRMFPDDGFATHPQSAYRIHPRFKITYKDFKFVVSGYTAVEIIPKTEEAKKILETMFEMTESRRKFMENYKAARQHLPKTHPQKISDKQLLKLAQSQPYIFRSDPHWYSVVKCNWYLENFRAELIAYLDDIL